MFFVSLLPAPDKPRKQPGRKTPVPALQARAAALIAATHEANARRLAEAKAHAALIIAEAELANADFLRLAEEQAAMLLAAMPSARRLPAAPPTAMPEPLVEGRPQADGQPVESSPPAAEPAPQALGDDKPPARIHPELGDQARASIDGGVDLIAGPFARFSQLAAFTRAVRGLPGVTSLDTREFLKGTVHLRLRYDDPIPLSVRLAELNEFRPSIVEARPGRVELRVNLSDPETPAVDDQVEDAA